MPGTPAAAILNVVGCCFLNILLLLPRRETCTGIAFGCCLSPAQFSQAQPSPAQLSPAQLISASSAQPRLAQPRPACPACPLSCLPCPACPACPTCPYTYQVAYRFVGHLISTCPACHACPVCKGALLLPRKFTLYRQRNVLNGQK